MAYPDAHYDTHHLVTDGLHPAIYVALAGEVETWQGRVEGWDAAVEVLMPLGAAALGMTLIGLIFRLTPG